MSLHVKRANRWRTEYNPLRGLTMGRVATMLMDGEQGRYAAIQWLYRFVEKRDATVRALKRRRLSAIGKLDWDIKILDEDDWPAGATQAMAERQQDALFAGFNSIGNLRKAFVELAKAEFRGYTHLEKHREDDRPDGRVVHLEPVPQWHWVRQGLNGDWRYDADARGVIARGVEIERADFIMREVEDPIDEIATICFLRKGLSQKDWDAFVETYGVPPLFVVMPDGVPDGKEDEYQEMAESVVADGRGAVPHGTAFESPGEGIRGVAPFEKHLNYQDSQIVLAGTSGKLTMLNDATGIGGSQSDVHEDTFDELAEAEAMEISELLQEQHGDDILEALFPGQPHLAYFELAPVDQEDITAVVRHARDLKQAGYHIKTDELSRRTGYELEERAPSQPPPVEDPDQPGTLRNRRGGAGDPVHDLAERRMQRLLANSAEAEARAHALDLEPIAARLQAALDEDDMEKAVGIVNRLREDWPSVLGAMLRDSQAAETIENAMVAALFDGAARGAVQRGEAA